MTYDEMLEKTNLLNKITILCDKFDTSSKLKTLIKNMNIEQLKKCEIMLSNKIITN